MKRKFLTLAVSLGLMSTAYAQFGSLFNKGAPAQAEQDTGGSDVSALVESFNRDSQNIREVTAYSLLQIKAALDVKENMAAIKALNDSLSKTTDPKEAASIQGKIIKEHSLVVQQLLESKEAKQKLGKLSPEIQKKVGKSIFAVAVAGMRIPGMLKKGQEAIEGVGSNPMMLTKIFPIKDGVALFSESLPTMTKIASIGFQLMKDVKMDPGTPTANTDLKKVEISIPE